MSRQVDHLKEDDIIPGQLFVCISFLSPEGLRNCKVRGLKIRGVFATKEKADAHAKNLQDIDNDFHVFVGEVGKWLPWDPDPNSIADQIYKEEELQKLMEAYKKNREHAAELEKERKNELLKNAKIDNKKQSRLNRLRQKIQKNNAEKEQDTTEQEQEANTNELLGNKTVQKIQDDINMQELLVDDLKKELNDVTDKHEECSDKILFENLNTSLKQDDNTDTAFELDVNLKKIADLYNDIYH